MQVTDEAIVSFFEGSILRTTLMKVHREGVKEAWVVVSGDDKRSYLGTAIYRDGHWTAFLGNPVVSYRVKSFTAAVQLIELSHDADWTEKPSGAKQVDRVFRKVEEP